MFLQSNHVLRIIGQFFNFTDTIPAMEELESTPWADPLKKRRSSPYVSKDLPVNGLFFCESSMFYFKKRKFNIIGHNLDNLPLIPQGPNDIPSIFLGINHIAKNTDTDFLTVILDENA